jgi:hypothetical protein
MSNDQKNDLSTRSTAKIGGRLVLPSYRFVGKWYIYEQNCKDKQPTDREKKKQNLLKNIVWIGNRKKHSFRSRGREAERALGPISKQIYKGKLVEQPEKKDHSLV